MNEAVLVDADIDEGAELGDVGDDAFEDHVGLDVCELADLFVEAGGDELVARVAAGFAEFLEDIVDGEAACGEIFYVDLRQELRGLDEFGDGCVE